jgi:hypothetical protein
MAGAVVTGAMNPGAGATAKRAEVVFSVAGPADEAELRALLRATPMAGAVRLRFEREPDYFAGGNDDGAGDTTIIARQAGRVVCLGRCSRRTVYVNGIRRESGYLGELRLLPNTPRGLAVLQAGYAFFDRLEAARADGAAGFYFTSVATTNRRARAVLAGGRLGLPEYQPLAELVTVAWPVSTGRTWGEGRLVAAVAGIGTVAGLETVDAGELTEFLDQQARRYALAMPWTAASWPTLRRQGLGPEHFCVVRRAGRIVAAAGIWDQSGWRQTVVDGYVGVTARIRPLINGLAWLAGRPGLPAAGARLKQASVHPLAVVADANAAEVGALLHALEKRAAALGVEWLVASLAAEDPLRAVLQRRRGAREYLTQLYAVNLPGSVGMALDLDGQPVRPEAGRL